MSNKGYGFEHFIEGYFLQLTNQKITDPIFWHGKVNRSFRVPGSGAMSSLAGDVVTELPFLTTQFMVECKHRKQRHKDGPVFRVPLKDLHKNLSESTKEDKLSLFAISYKGTSENRIQIIVDKETYLLFQAFPLFKSALKYDLPKDKYKIDKSLILKKKYLDEVYSQQKDYVISVNDEWFVMSWDYFDKEMRELARRHYEITK